MTQQPAYQVPANYYPHPAPQPMPPTQYVVPVKQRSYTAAILLSFFLGFLGVDRFYLGHVGLGFAKLFLGWATLGIWPVIDFILIVARSTTGLKQIHWT